MCVCVVEGGVGGGGEGGSTGPVSNPVPSRKLASVGEAGLQYYGIAWPEPA